jgi:hypothetical protein
MAFYIDQTGRFTKGLLKITFGVATGAVIYGTGYLTFGVFPMVMAAFDRNASIIDYATTPFKWLHDGVRDCNYAVQKTACHKSMKEQKRGFRYYS